MTELNVGLLYKACKYMSLKVVDLNQWTLGGNGQSLGERCAYKQRSEQSRPPCKGYSRKLRGLDSGTLKCLTYNGNDIGLMSPRSEFGDNATVCLVYILRSDDIAHEHTVTDDCRRGVVARGFYTENYICHRSELNCLQN